MSDIEERLRDAMDAARDQVGASADLWFRIQADLGGVARRRARLRWAAAGAAIAVAAAAIVAVVLLHPPAPRTRVSTHPPTIQEFIDRTNQDCDQFNTQANQINIVFPTAAAYKTGADHYAALLQRTIDQDVGLGAPPQGDAVVAQVANLLQTALADAEQASTKAAAGDTQGASNAFNRAQYAVYQAGTAVADFGATHCRPTGGPPTTIPGP